MTNLLTKRRFGAVILALVISLSACTGSMSKQNNGPALVVVAGATGGTGRALVRNLLEQGYAVRAFVRDESKARVVLGDMIEYAEGDVREFDTIAPALVGATYVISAIGSTRTEPGNNPEAVDFGGIRNLAEASANAKIRQFVLVSSSGVTQEDHFLNRTFNNILLWKFRGEEALRNSGVPYTIVRPGGLVNTAGGKERLVFAQGDTTTGRISREDVALICIAALSEPTARNRTFETYSSEITGANDWSELFGALQADK